MAQTLLGGPRSHLTAEEVAATLTLDHGPRVRHGVEVLDTSDKVTGETLPVDMNTGGEVQWSYRPPEAMSGGSTDAAEVRRTATLNLVGDVSDELVLARRFRPWTEIMSPDGNWVRWWLGVFVTTLPPVNDDGILITRSLVLADKTHRYKTRLLDAPLTIPAGTNLVAWVNDSLISEFGEAGLYATPSDVTLSEAKTFPVEASYMEVYCSALEMAGYDQLTNDVAGRPRSVPLSDLANRGPSYTYGPGHSKVITAGKVEPLLPSLPNWVRFVARQGPSLPEDGNGWTERKNQSTGPGSIDQRGKVFQQITVEAENQAELEAIADADAQRYFAGGGLTFEGHIGLNPSLDDRDVIGLVKPRLDLTGEWNLTSWSYSLRAIADDSSILMPIRAEKRVEVTS